MRATGAGPAFTFEPVEADVEVAVDELHNSGDGAVVGLVLDLVVHIGTDSAVVVVTLGRGAEFYQVAGLAGVHQHCVADFVGEGDGILGAVRSELRV